MQRTSRVVMPKINPIRTDVVMVALEPGAKWYQMGECIICVGKDEQWHMSISCKSRYPTWDEISHARYNLIPDEVTMAMLLPPMAEYVNIHPNTMHIWEVESPFKGVAK